MTRAAKYVMNEFFPDITMAYGKQKLFDCKIETNRDLISVTGCSDEYSFIFRRKAFPFNRRQNKISTLVASAFTAAFVFHWSKFFQTPSVLKSNETELKPQPLLYPPSFDARCVLYPTREVLIDYMRWRQVDCHINNLYNTTFYALTGDYTKYSLKNGGGDRDDVIISQNPTNPIKLTPREAEQKLCGTNSSDKNEILFTEHGTNYNNEIEQFKKGTLVALPKEVFDESLVNAARVLALKENKKKQSNTSYAERDIEFRVLSEDIINEKFWNENSYLIDS